MPTDLAEARAAAERILSVIRLENDSLLSLEEDVETVTRAYLEAADREARLRRALAEHRSVMFGMLTPMMDGSERQRAKELLGRPGEDAGLAPASGGSEG